MSPRLRRFALTAHVATSVGWLGAVAAFLALAVVGLVGPSPTTTRGAYIAAGVITWAVIVPLCLASLLTGVIQSLGTPWGLFRHYWVVVKLALTLIATLLLLLHTQPIGYLADAAATTPALGSNLHPVRIQLVFDATLALLVLLATTALATYKPRGMTRYALRKQRDGGRAMVAERGASAGG